MPCYLATAAARALNVAFLAETLKFSPFIKKIIGPSHDLEVLCNKLIQKVKERHESAQLFFTGKHWSVCKWNLTMLSGTGSYFPKRGKSIKYWISIKYPSTNLHWPWSALLLHSKISSLRSLKSLLPVHAGLRAGCSALGSAGPHWHGCCRPE